MDIRSLPQHYNIDELSSLAFLKDVQLDNWDFVKQCRLANKVFGEGTIISITGPDKDGLTLIMKFDHNQDHKEKRFLSSSFYNGYFRLLGHPDFPDEVNKSLWKTYEYSRLEYENTLKAEEERAKREEEEQQRREQEELARQLEIQRQRLLEEQPREEFSRLKVKYEINSTETSPTSPLYMILVKLEKQENLDKEDQVWLNINQLFAPLGLYFERCFENDPSDIWPITSAISNWRKAGKPDHALKISNGVTTSDKKSQAALLTSRGGAFRDLSDFDNAIKNAREAISLTPSSYYPYNLLGAILYQTGEPEEADEQFQRATKLGAPAKEVDFQIKTSVRLAEADQQRKVAKYLLEKDPVRYKWAEFYLTRDY